MKSKYKILIFTILTSVLSVLVFSIFRPDTSLSASNVICTNGSPSQCNADGKSWWDTNNNMRYDEGESLVVEQSTPAPTPSTEPTVEPVLGTTRPAATTSPTTQPSSNQQCRTVCVQEQLVCN